MSDELDRVAAAARAFADAWYKAIDPELVDHDIDGSEMEPPTLEDLKEEARGGPRNISVEAMDVGFTYRSLVWAVRNAEASPFLESTPDEKNN